MQMDLSAAYWNDVFAPSLDKWTLGTTPNPDVLCNSKIKFGEFLKRVDGEPSYGRQARRQWIVTGHYAGIHYFYPQEQEYPLLHGRLHRALDATKDQSYFLSGVRSVHLGRTHFPLTQMNKVDVRQCAKELGMPTAQSEESMGLCFVGERRRKAESPSRESNIWQSTGRLATQMGFAGFLSDYIEPQPGPIVNTKGEQVGMHNGLHTLTIGQKARIGGAKYRYFVAAKQPSTNRIMVVPGGDHPWLQCCSLTISSFHLVSRDDARLLSDLHKSGDTLHAQIRHRQDAVPCTLEMRQTDEHIELRIHFAEPVSSVAEGQVCALYNGTQCLGSGTITCVDTPAVFV